MLIAVPMARGVDAGGGDLVAPLATVAPEELTLDGGDDRRVRGEVSGGHRDTAAALPSRVTWLLTFSVVAARPAHRLPRDARSGIDS